MAKYGFRAINDGTKAGLNSLAQIQNSLKLNDTLTAGRVLSVVLDDTHPKYTELGGPKAIGAVEFIKISGGTADYSTVKQSDDTNIAYPLYPGNKHYPLINEIVYVVSQPSNKLQSRTNDSIFYYVGIVNLWNHPHHNALPYSAGNNAPNSNKPLNQIALGFTDRQATGSGKIKLGNYFQERSNINPLQPFEGDIIVEGRFGNSLRLSATGGDNPWLQGGEQGDPITILRNGQGVKKDNGWDLITEDVNQDNSSIYLTSTQQLNFNPSSTNDYFSYSEKPEAASKYKDSQIIINSGRIFLNSNYDHLLLSSAKTINLNAVKSINLDTTDSIVLQGGKILLGSKSAVEPVLLGDATVSQLEAMLSILKELLIAASTAANAGGPIPTLNSKALDLLTRANLINLNLTKSTRSFTV